MPVEAIRNFDGVVADRVLSPWNHGIDDHGLMKLYIMETESKDTARSMRAC